MMSAYIPPFLLPQALALPGNWSKALKAVAAARAQLIFVLKIVQFILAEFANDPEVLQLFHTLYGRSIQPDVVRDMIWQYLTCTLKTKPPLELVVWWLANNLQDLLDPEHLHWVINDYETNQRISSPDNDSVFLKLGAWIQFYTDNDGKAAWSSNGSNVITIWTGIFGNTV